MHFQDDSLQTKTDAYWSEMVCLLKCKASNDITGSGTSTTVRKVTAKCYTKFLPYDTFVNTHEYRVHMTQRR